MNRKELGKIQRASVGMGGYQDVMLGVSFTLGSDSWGVADFWGTWARDPDAHCKWTVADQDAQFAATMRKLLAVLKAAKKERVEQLVGVPIEVTFDGNRLESWRVLTEVV